MFRTILPIVDKADILPETVPISLLALDFIFTTNGDIIAKIKLGIENVIIAEITAAIIRF